MPQIAYSTVLRSGLFGGQSSGLMKLGVSADSSATVSQALCVGALSCWKVKTEEVTRDYTNG